MIADKDYIYPNNNPIAKGINDEKIKYRDQITDIVDSLKSNEKRRDRLFKAIIAALILFGVGAFASLVYIWEVAIPSLAISIPSFLFSIPMYRKSVGVVKKLNNQKNTMYKGDIDRSILEFSLLGYSENEISYEIERKINHFYKPNDDMRSFVNTSEMHIRELFIIYRDRYDRNRFNRDFSNTNGTTMGRAMPVTNDLRYDSGMNGFTDPEFGYNKPPTK